jgi:hypothetical protein
MWTNLFFTFWIMSGLYTYVGIVHPEKPEMDNPLVNFITTIIAVLFSIVIWPVMIYTEK